MLELVITAVPFALAWTVMLVALNLGHFWLYALLILPTAGLLVRLFMIQHTTPVPAIWIAAASASIWRSPVGTGSAIACTDIPW